MSNSSVTLPRHKLGAIVPNAGPPAPLPLAVVPQAPLPLGPMMRSGAAERN